MKKTPYRALAAAACLSLFAVNAEAQTMQVIVNDNFDTYGSQAAFETTWVPIGTVSPISAALSTEQFVSAGNSIKIAATATSGQERNRLTFGDIAPVSASGTKIVFSFDFYDTAPAAAPFRQSVNLQDGTAPSLANQLVSLGMNNNQSATNSGGNYYMARILGYVVTTGADPDGGPVEGGTLGTGAYFKLNDFGVGLRTLGWHNLKVIISTDDGLSTDYEFYVDNVLAERVSNVGTSTFRQFDNIALGSGVSNGSNAAYYDNMYLAVQTPEPTAAILGLAALFGGLQLRRRVKRVN